MTKSRFFSSLAAFAATGAVCAVALAATPYSVKLSLPQSVKPGHTFKVKASGVSSASSQLTVFASSKSCAATSKAEAGRAGKAILSKGVARSYTSSKRTKASRSQGLYHACAYLTAGNGTRAHTAKKFFVVSGGY